MDFSNFDTSQTADDGVAMHVTGPNGVAMYGTDEKPVEIVLLGADGAVLTALSNKQTNRYLKNKGQVAITAELAVTNEIERLVAATVSWSNVVLNGDQLECTEDNARMMYRTYPWLREQARAFIDERANFLKASLKS